MEDDKIITKQELYKKQIVQHPETRGCLIVDDTCIVRGGISTGTVVGNEEMGYFWESWDFGSSDVIYDTYEEAKAALIEYFWLLKEIEEG